MSPLKKVWICPECRRSYRIVRTANPTRCPGCDSAAALLSDPPRPTPSPPGPVQRKSGAAWLFALVGAAMLLCGGGGIFLLGCLGVLSKGSSDGGGLNAEQLYERVKPAVVLIVIYDEDGKRLGHGSGFFVDQGGTVVTNYHVAAAPGAAALALVRDNEQIAIVTRLVAYDEAYDLAVFDSGLRDTSFLPLAPSEARVGSHVYAVGNPLGLTWSFSDGLVSAVRPWSGTIRPWVQTTTPISSGSSGGPLIDAAGQLVGVTTENWNPAPGSTVQQNLNFASPAAALRDLLKQPRGQTPIAALAD